MMAAFEKLIVKIEIQYPTTVFNSRPKESDFYTELMWVYKIL